MLTWFYFTLGDFCCQGAPMSSTRPPFVSFPKSHRSQFASRDSPSAGLPSEPTSPAVPSERSHPKPASRLGPSTTDYEVLTSAELAQRLRVKESWVVDQSKRSRTSDPIPVFRLGKHRRYRWGSPELNGWLERRAGYNTTRRKAGSSRNGGTIE